MKSISVILPYYNSSNTIERALISVQNQTYKIFDVIIVNDCSPDWKEAEVILEKFVNLNIKVLHHSKNKNGSAARNTGIKYAAGNFIALLDADDEWYPEHLEKCLVHYETVNESQTLVFCKNLVKTGGFIDIVMPSKNISNIESISDYLFVNDGFISTPSMFGLSSIFKNNLFDESLIRHQDYKFLLDLEQQKIKVTLSNHIGVIVHWEDNDIEKKGGTWEYSLNWVIKEKKLFTKKAFKYFILKNAIFPLLVKKQRNQGVSLFFKYCMMLYPLKTSLKIFSMMIFGKIIYSRINT